MNYLAMQKPVDTSYKQRIISDLGRNIAALSIGIMNAAVYGSEKQDYATETEKYYRGITEGLKTADPADATGYVSSVPKPPDFKSLPEEEHATAAKQYLGKISGYMQQAYASPDFLDKVVAGNKISEEQAVNRMADGSNVAMKLTGTPILTADKYTPMLETARVNGVLKDPKYSAHLDMPIPLIEDVSKSVGIGEKPAESGSVASVATATEKPIDKSVQAPAAIKAPKTAAPIAIGSTPAPAAPAPAQTLAPSTPTTPSATPAVPPAAIGASQSKTTTVSKTAPAATGIVPPAKYEGATDGVSQARAAYYDMIAKKVSPERAAAEAAKLFPDAQAKRIRELMTKNPDLGAGREMVTLIKTEMPWAQVDDKMLAAMQADVGMLEARKGRELAAATESSKAWADRLADKQSKDADRAIKLVQDAAAKELRIQAIETQIAQAKNNPKGEASPLDPFGNVDTKATPIVLDVAAAERAISSLRSDLTRYRDWSEDFAASAGKPIPARREMEGNVDQAREQLVYWLRDDYINLNGLSADAATKAAKRNVAKMSNNDVLNESAIRMKVAAPAQPGTSEATSSPSDYKPGIGPRPIPVQAPSGASVKPTLTPAEIEAKAKKWNF